MPYATAWTDQIPLWILAQIAAPIRIRVLENGRVVGNEIGEIGQGVEIVSYAFSGSAELVQNVIAKLSNQCHCYLIQNHGALSLGSDMERAMKNVELLENVARIYYHALATGLDIDELPEAAIEHFADMRKARFLS